MPIVNGLEPARAALHAGTNALQSPDYAACHAGVNYYHALLDQLRAEFPENDFTFTLCCGDDPAIAHDALRLGFTRIRLCAGDGVMAQLQEMARAMGATIIHNNCHAVG